MLGAPLVVGAAVARELPAQVFVGACGALGRNLVRRGMIDRELEIQFNVRSCTCVEKKNGVDRAYSWKHISF
jgi:hypothetical protein